MQYSLDEEDFNINRQKVLNQLRILILSSSCLEKVCGAFPCRRRHSIRSDSKRVREVIALYDDPFRKNLKSKHSTTTPPPRRLEVIALDDRPELHDVVAFADDPSRSAVNLEKSVALSELLHVAVLCPASMRRCPPPAPQSHIFQLTCL